MRRFAARFTWQLAARLAEEGIIVATASTPSTRSGGLLLVSLPFAVPSGLVRPAALLLWLVTGHGPGARLQRLNAGGPNQLSRINARDPTQ